VRVRSLDRRLPLLAALLLPSILPSSARADGDPASDVLIVRDLYAPFAPRLTPARAKQLESVLAQTRDQGFRVKVAIIASQADLGAYPTLFGKAQRYVHLLSRELRFAFKRGALLVVMPKEAAVVQLPGQRAADRALRGLRVRARPGPPIGPGLTSYNSDDLARAALAGVERLADAVGVRVSVPPLPREKPRAPASAGGGSSSLDWRAIAFGGVLGALVLVAIGGALRGVARRPRRL
jgi:hypothetical protein